MRRGVVFVVIGLGVLALAGGAGAVTVAVAGGRDQRAPADAIVVLGAAQYNGRPSPVFRARLDHAATLYRRGLPPPPLVAAPLRAPAPARRDGGHGPLARAVAARRRAARARCPRPAGDTGERRLPHVAPGGPD